MTIEKYCILGACDQYGCQHRHNDGTCVYEYDANHYQPQHRWQGDGPPPRRWAAADGTIVYRTFADYCD